MGKNILAIGEVLWDLLPSGKQLGGAPANFTHTAQCLEANATLLSRIGEDQAGKELLQVFQDKNLSTDLLQIDNSKPTGVVHIHFTDKGEPYYQIENTVAWDYIAVTPQALAAAAQADAIYFGSLSQRSATTASTLSTLLAAAPEQATIVFDLNLRQDFFNRQIIEASLQAATVAKLNHEELAELSKLFNLQGTSEQKIHWLAERYQINTVALTNGAEGSILYHQGEWSYQPTKAEIIVDTVGAGDAFTAALTAAFIHGLDAEASHQLAADTAAYLCSQSGGMPNLPTSISERLIAIA